MTFVDIILILFLVCGALAGFKKGAIRSLVALVGTIALVVISYYLKNPVAEILFDYAPFFDFAGEWQGLTTLNILLYESIAYIIVFVVLSSILSLLLKISGIIEKILTFTIILGIPSKIIGAVLGFLEALVFSFLVLFLLLQFNGSSKYVSDSSMAMSILDKTPLIGNMISGTYEAIMDINDTMKKYEENKGAEAQNREILNIMLSYEVVTPETTQKLIDSKKLEFAGAQSILNTYKEENND